MCGIFGIYDPDTVNKVTFKHLAIVSERRGSDSSGLAYSADGSVNVFRMNASITQLLKKNRLPIESTLVIGHSRLITDGNSDNQPVVYDDIVLIHNGILTNHMGLWEKYPEYKRRQEIDSEIIAVIAQDVKKRQGSFESLKYVLAESLEGAASIFLLDKSDGELFLFSNTGSLYVSHFSGGFSFASERHFLETAGFENVKQVGSFNMKAEGISNADIHEAVYPSSSDELVYQLSSTLGQSNLLKYPSFKFLRCSRCVLPETMPFIEFNKEGVCNYCHNFTPIVKQHNLDGLLEKVEIHKGRSEYDCIVPFSGGRDSTFLLDYVVNTLKLKPVTMTYDWGMVTDLGRRNISRVTSKLNVENILVAANIRTKRQYIKTNLAAWLKAPDLGMLNILMAGDKHFFRYIESVKREHNAELNVWGMNPLETTHFKAGFLGVEPYFNSRQVFNTGVISQLDYHGKRLLKMFQNPSYFNLSLYDTYSGEYFRSIQKKTGMVNLFDYVPWNEADINASLDKFDWEKAVDTPSTWRIGDGTAGFYNYVYFLFAGFTENDTFRSNEIRNGLISRNEALKLLEVENKPRYQNIKWYLDLLGFDFQTTISTINHAAARYHVSNSIDAEGLI